MYVLCPIGRGAYERSLREGECRGTAAASNSCVINIRTNEGERAEFQRMGGALLLRNAEHHINSIVKWGGAREREREREGGREGGRERAAEREGTLSAVGAFCRSAFALESPRFPPKSKDDSVHRNYPLN